MICEKSQAETGAANRKLLKQGAVHTPKLQLVSSVRGLQHFRHTYSKQRTNGHFPQAKDTKFLTISCDGPSLWTRKDSAARRCDECGSSSRNNINVTQRGWLLCAGSGGQRLTIIVLATANQLSNFEFCGNLRTNRIKEA